MDIQYVGWEGVDCILLLGIGISGRLLLIR
jgi:hypothetical protein